jgi:predicted nucleic-acid-binding protein
MTGVDTNILIRHITQDDPVQSPIATRLIERSLTPRNPGFVSIATLLETTWVLESFFKLTTPQVVAVVERILQVDTFEVQHQQAVFLAVQTLGSGAATFEDALIGELGLAAGCNFTWTFDKKASRLRGFKLLT